MRLLNFVLRCDLLSKKQYGIIKKLSTNKGLEFLNKEILANIDSKKPYCSHFLRFSQSV